MAFQIIAGLDEFFVIVAVILITIVIRESFKSRNMPPGPRGWPIVGSLPSLSREEPYASMMELGKAYGGRGNLVTLRLGSAAVVVLNSYEAIHEALVKKGEAFSSRPSTPYSDIIPKKGIAAAPFSHEWKEQKSFALKTLRSFGMGKKSLEGKISEELSYVFDEISKFNGKPFDIQNILSLSVSNIICSIVKGERFDYQDPNLNLLLQHIKYMFTNAGNASVLTFFPILKYIPILNKQMNILRNGLSAFQEYFKPLIEQHKREIQEDDVRNFIDAYLVETKRTKDLPDSFFHEEQLFFIVINDLFGAGTETTSTTLYWVVLYLVVYPEIQKRAQREIDGVVGRNRLPTLMDEPNLPFTRAVIRETQRLATITPLGLPHYSTENAQIMGYDIPGNTRVLVNFWAVHHDSSAWDEPYSFKPDRFIDVNGKLTKPKQYIPFSIGRRECLGEQLAIMKLYLFTTSLLHRYSFKLPEGAPPPSLKGKNGLTRFPDPYKVIIEER